MEARRVKQAIVAGEARLGAGGRLVVRPSGTEPLIRVMAECDDEVLLASVVDDICEAVLAVSRGTEDRGAVQAAE